MAEEEHTTEETAAADAENIADELLVSGGAGSTVEEGDAVLELDIKMSSGVIYDYLLRHCYSSAAGLLGSCFGAFGLIIFATTLSVPYLIMGLIVLLYLPVTLFKRSKMVMLTDRTYKRPLHYCFYEKGFTVSQDDIKNSMEWEGCTKAVSTKKSIIIYTGKNNASIFPRDQIPGGAAELISVIARYMEPKRIKIRY